MGMRFTIGSAVIAAMPLLYVGTYLAMLDPGPQIPVGNLVSTTLIRMPSYRFGGEAADWFFAPLNSVDQSLRPTYWHEHHFFENGIG
jgi:hypothetical protein